MAAPSKIVDLRNLLAERFPPSPSVAQSRLRTGLTTLDAVTGGGLPKGAITELISPHVSAGSALMIHRLLQVAQEEGAFLALIDGRDSFDPQPFGNDCLRHLLWIRCGQTLEAIKAADLLLRDGNFPLVILDLVLNDAGELRKIPQTSWYRLQRLAEPKPTALLVLTRRSAVSSAQLKLTLENNWTLQDFQRDDNFSRLQMRVQRLQGARIEATEAG